MYLLNNFGYLLFISKKKIIFYLYYLPLDNNDGIKTN